jgi:membrane protein DedA with SNARE-associated domain
MKNINSKVFWILFVLSNLIWLPLLFYRTDLFLKKYPIPNGGYGGFNPEMPVIFLILLFDCIILIFDRKKKKSKQDLIMISIVLILAIILLFYTIYNTGYTWIGI